MTVRFAERQDSKQVEQGLQLAPKFDDKGLLTAVCTDAESGDLLMVAFMNEEALRYTIETREAHFYSRSRGKQWKKGESSGHVLQVHEMRIDCDQDCLWLKCTIGNGGGACHVGYKSCFYRNVELGDAGDEPVALSFNEADKVYDPDQVYGKK